VRESHEEEKEREENTNLVFNTAASLKNQFPIREPLDFVQILRVASQHLKPTFDYSDRQNKVLGGRNQFGLHQIFGRNRKRRKREEKSSEIKRMG
jgi:hypothetical protein